MEKLKRLREASGLSQVKLAARADLNPATVNQIERGMRDASPGTLRKLADALGVSLYELMEEETPKDQAPLPLEEATAGAEPLHNAYEALGRVFASSWKDDLEEWNERIPTGTSPDPVEFGLLIEWSRSIARISRLYESVVLHDGHPPRAELEDTLKLMENAELAALEKVKTAFEPAKTYAEFQKIVKANNLEAILSDAVGDE